MVGLSSRSVVDRYALDARHVRAMQLLEEQTRRELGIESEDEDGSPREITIQLHWGTGREMER